MSKRAAVASAGFLPLQICIEEQAEKVPCRCSASVPRTEATQQPAAPVAESCPLLRRLTRWWERLGGSDHPHTRLTHVCAPKMPEYRPGSHDWPGSSHTSCKRKLTGQQHDPSPLLCRFLLLLQLLPPPPPHRSPPPPTLLLFFPQALTLPHQRLRLALHGFMKAMQQSNSCLCLERCRIQRWHRGTDRTTASRRSRQHCEAQR